MAMSPNMALRRSPNPGAFTAADIQDVPRNLLTTNKAVNASRFDILGDDQQVVLPDWNPLFPEIGIKSRMITDLLLVD